jgi:hypothetical protein
VSCAPIDGAHQKTCCTCTLVRRVALLFPHHPPPTISFQLLHPPPHSMSHTHPTSAQASASSSNFQFIFDNALRAYERRLKKDLRNHPLAAQLQDCKSPDNILDVLQQQVDELNRSRRRNENWTRWLDPTVKVLHAFSGTLGEHVTSVCLGLSTCIRPALSYLFDRHFHRQKPSLLQSASSFWCVSFSYVRAAYRNAITSQAAKNVRASEDALLEVFDRLEAFFRRLEIYTEAALDQRMVDIVAKIMAEVLNILGITTNEIKQCRMSKCLLYGYVAADRMIFREISKEGVQKHGQLDGC